MFKRFQYSLVVFLILSVLFCSASCKKESNANSNAKNSVVSENTTTSTTNTEQKKTSSDANPVSLTKTSEINTSTTTGEKITSDNSVAIDLTESTESKTEMVDESVSIEPESSKKLTDLVEPTVASALESFKVGKLMFNEDGSITGYYRYGMVVQAEVTVGNDKTEIFFNSIAINGDDINRFIQTVAQNYPTLASYVTYTISANSIIFYYPEAVMGGKYYKLQTMVFLNELVTKTLDEMNSSSEILITVNEKGNKIFTHNYEVFGVETILSGSSSMAIVESDRPFTKEEITMAASILLANYSDLQYVEYAIDENRIVLTYPEISENEIKTIMESLDNLIKAYTPMPLEDLTVQEETSVDEIAAPIDIVAEKEDKASTFDEDIKLTVVPSTTTEVLETESPVKAVEKIRQSVVFTADLKTTKSFKSDVSISASYEAQLKDWFALGAKTGVSVTGVVPFETYAKLLYKNFFARGGVGFEYNIKEPSFTVLGEFGIGCEIPLEDMFSVVVELGAKVTNFNTSPLTYGYFSIGGKVNF